MKNPVKILTAPIMFALALLMGSCNQSTGSDSAHSAHSSTQAVSSASAHQHTYRCVMNCEKGKTYDQPGKCPVCGMELEHYDEGTDNGLSYRMAFTSSPQQLEANQEGLLSFTPKVVGNDSEVVPLDAVHEKKIHLIVVSNDLSYFDHVHPDYQSTGSYNIQILPQGTAYRNGAGETETRFEYGGNYFLFADYQPSGGSHQVEKVAFQVKGPEKPEVTYTSEKLTGTSGAYSVALQPEGGKLETKSPVHLAGTVLKNGQPVDPNTLENYLGAKAHMVVISLKDKEYLHVHPEVTNGKFDLHTTFASPGIYRGWIQFKANGQIHTVDFTLNVPEGTGAAVAHNAQAMPHHSH